MLREVFITCAITGGGSNVDRSPYVPVSPEAIADSAIEAARAGAAAVHIHVRDHKTRRGVLNLALYREVVQRIRRSDVNPVINLTTANGGDLVLAGPDSPLPPDPVTDMVGALDRLAHVEDLRPEICTLDCGSMNGKSNGEYIMVNSAGMLRAMARRIQELGVHPELEVFDTGHLQLANDLVKEGLIRDPPLIQLCMGVGYGAPNDLTTLTAMVHQLPPGAVYSAFSVGPMQLPYAALAPLCGANVRVGLEDNLYLSRGRLATNAQLVQRAIEILDWIGVRVLSPSQMREKLKLNVHAREAKHV
ncbi:3-keto-5-aminohexanoate cleavage protein [Bradyrhizobium sp. CCBAU 51627]|uniref:3-keto-5-aminohexanoate cleavage protein n=1 Tax=Bradyrhizobium sp. CCBAU 51627 TaxID=1325088 RepID=UPI002306A643|nr:3-keto-5-aminohexanoate cleavage protein [Bradyrhizobium sp. CCBAU 51627]MDA9436922.1 NADPH dependent quinone reductase [Bradyrhizobium sp. CCBAU 51627]